jgi:two-component system, cell cycle sensor histidine kinase and response regulator CckA
LHEVASFLSMEHTMSLSPQRTLDDPTRDNLLRETQQTEPRLDELAINAATQGVIITNARDPVNPIIYASPGFEHLTGYSTSEVLGQDWRFLIGADTDQSVVEEICLAIQTGMPFIGDLLNYRKDGTPFWNEVSIKPHRDTTGHVARFIGVLTDVTSRKTQEMQLRQSQKMQAVGQLAGGIAHDFNNLLTVINGSTEMALREAPPNHPLREWLVGIKDASERAKMLTKQLLAFSRKSDVKPQLVNLNEVIETVMGLLRRLIGKNHTLVTELHTSPCRVRIDVSQAEQLIMNLAINAKDAMPSGGPIVISTETIIASDTTDECPAGRFVRFSLTDSGTGMTDHVKSHIFEPFFTTKRPGHGTGLGLATVYGIVEQFGGKIFVDSVLGRGTTFTVLLPEVCDESEASADIKKTP